KQEWIVRPNRERKPISNAIMVYTDAGKKLRRAAVTWQKDGVWQHKILVADERDSLQTLELLAVVWALIHFKGPLNIVTDSLYVTGVVEIIEDAAIKEVQNKRLFELFT
ncbi:POK8 protein, partial [Syrrhaptes paradoxus]|nr:POK8 protein [Syrrhaptes paradoxus]